VHSDIYCFLQSGQPVPLLWRSAVYCILLHLSLTFKKLLNTFSPSLSISSNRCTPFRFPDLNSLLPILHTRSISSSLIWSWYKVNIFNAGLNTVERSSAPVDTQESRCRLDTEGRRHSCCRSWHSSLHPQSTEFLHLLWNDTKHSSRSTTLCIKRSFATFCRPLHNAVAASGNSSNTDIMVAALVRNNMEIRKTKRKQKRWARLDEKQSIIPSYQHVLSSDGMSTAHCLMVNEHNYWPEQGHNGTSFTTVCGISSC